MCRSLLTLYEWCQCHESEVHIACNGVAGGSCTTVASETVRMQCYCRRHATTGWETEAKARRKQRKLDKKKNKNSTDTNGSNRIRRRWSVFPKTEKSDVTSTA